MKIRLFIVLLAFMLIGIRFSLVAQDFNLKVLNETSNRLAGKLTGSVFYMPPGGNLNHFYHSEWLEGNILLTDGDRFEGVRLRYLAYGDELVAYNANLKQLFIVDKEKVAEFDVTGNGSNQKFVKIYFNGLLPEDRYFEQLYEGTQQLLAFRFIEKLNSGLYKDRLGRLRNTVYVMNTHYYMYAPETGFKKLRTNRKSVISLFPDRKKELRRLIRRSNSSVKNETGLIEIFRLMEEEGFFF